MDEAMTGGRCGPRKGLVEGTIRMLTRDAEDGVLKICEARMLLG
jgi:hypothetical protein